LFWRFKLTIGVLVHVQSDEQWKSELPKKPNPSDVETVRERTIRFLANGFRARETTDGSRISP
jgi:hypothetical protein